MPIYQFKCNTCHVIWERFYPISEYSDSDMRVCPECQQKLGRIYSFAKVKTFEPHYNSSLGKYVSTQRDMKNTLRNLEVEAAERLGYEPKYALYDPRELESTVTEEGMDATNRHKVATGQMEVRKWH